VPLLVSRPSAASASQDPSASLIADYSPLQSIWPSALASSSPNLWTDPPSRLPSAFPSAFPSATPTVAATATATGSPNASTVATARATAKPSGPFVATGFLHKADTGETATRLNDGRVLITPGTCYDGASSVEAEIYDPSTGKFSQTGPVTEIVASPEATLLADGRS